MKFSKFNSVIELDEGLIIYNAFSGGILRLDNEHATRYRTLWDNKDEMLLGALKKGNMIIPDAMDERVLLRHQSNIASNDTSTMSLTIAPTMACNFRCPYCYEKGKEYTTLDDRILEAVVSYINKHTESGGIRTLAVAWYGGEPLLRMDLIRRIRQGITTEGTVLKQVIVTNGYLLSEDIAAELEAMGVERAQVTIDGPPEIHNKSRIHHDGRDTFNTILENIKRAIKHIRVSIRVNVNRETLSQVDRLLDYLDDFELSGEVSVYLAPIDNFHGKCNGALCLDHEEFSVEEFEFLKRNANRGYFRLNVGSFIPTICSATCVNSFVIDPLGNLYKCWEYIGDEEHKVGDVFTGLNFGTAMKRWQDYDYLKHEECQECSILPACKGGCPKRVVDGNFHVCSTNRYNLQPLLELMHQRKPIQQK